MVAAVAGITDIGLGVDANASPRCVRAAKRPPGRSRIRRSDATRSPAAAGSVADLVERSDG